MPGQTTFDRVIVMAVAALLGAFALTVAAPVISQAGADEAAGKRDDDLREIEAKDDDDDEGDSAKSDSSKGSGNGDGSKSKSRESNTTRGTGPSNTNTRDTNTGTWTRASR